MEVSSLIPIFSLIVIDNPDSTALLKLSVPPAVTLLELPVNDPSDLHHYISTASTAYQA
jgi:hypothetical protein